MKLTTAEINIIELIREEKTQSYMEGYRKGVGLTYCTKCGDDIKGTEPSLCGKCAS